MVKLGRYPASWFVLAAVVAGLSVQLERMIQERELTTRQGAPTPKLKPAGQPRPTMPSLPAPPVDSAIPRTLVRTVTVDRSRFAPIGEAKTPIVGAVLAHGAPAAAVLEESGRVTIWDVPLHKPLISFDTGLPKPIVGRTPPMWLYMPPRDMGEATGAGPVLVIGGSDGRVRRWYVASGKQPSLILWDHGDQSIVGIASMMGQMRVLSAEGSVLDLSPVPGGQSEKMPMPGGAVYDLASAHERGTAAFATAGGIYATDPMLRLNLIDSATTSHPVQVVFSPTGSHFASAWSDGEIRVYATAAQARVRTMRTKGRGPGLLAFNRDASLLAASSSARTIYVWPTTGDGAPVTIKGPRAPLRSMWFAPYDGSLVVAAQGDRYLRRLEVPARR
jgi:WD40 repeat protein